MSITTEFADFLHKIVNHLPAREESTVRALHADVDELTKATEVAEPAEPPVEPAADGEGAEHA